jgi:hypothetical protein
VVGQLALQSRPRPAPRRLQPAPPTRPATAPTVCGQPPRQHTSADQRARKLPHKRPRPPLRLHPRKPARDRAITSSDSASHRSRPSCARRPPHDCHESSQTTMTKRWASSSKAASRKITKSGRCTNQVGIGPCSASPALQPISATGVSQACLLSLASGTTWVTDINWVELSLVV